MNDNHKVRTNCNLCGADDTKLIYRKFDFDISQCRQCQLVYAGPMRPTREASWLRYNPNYFWDEYLPSLGVINGNYDLDAFDRRHAPMLVTIAPYQKESAILEIGCGGGFFLKAAERAGWQTVSGVEVSEAAVAFNQDELGLDVQHGTIEDVHFPPDSYDVIAIFDTIEHLFDPKQILQIAHQLLRPGGAVVLSTPNFDALSRYILGRSWAVLSPLEHLFYFAPTSLSMMLSAVGYVNVTHLKTFGGQGLYQTMNPAHNQDSQSWRARLYRLLVPTIGPFTYKLVQTLGRGDELFFLAEKR